MPFLLIAVFMERWLDFMVQFILQKEKILCNLSQHGEIRDYYVAFLKRYGIMIAAI